MSKECPNCDYTTGDNTVRFCPRDKSLLRMKSMEEEWVERRGAIKDVLATLVLNKADGYYIPCHWGFDFPPGWDFTEILKLKTGVDEVCPLMRTARAYISEPEPFNEARKVVLKVSGRGPDGRCRWCGNFRRSLRARTLWKGQGYSEGGRKCPFDAEQS